VDGPESVTGVGDQGVDLISELEPLLPEYGGSQKTHFFLVVFLYVQYDIYIYMTCDYVFVFFSETC
jgi:hypothetical protein